MNVITPSRIAAVLGTVALLTGALATTAAAEPGDPATEAAIAAQRASATAADKRSPETKGVAAQFGGLDPAIAAAMAAREARAAAKRSPETKGAAANSGGLDPAMAAAIAAREARAAAKRSPETKGATANSGGLDPAIAAAIAAHRTTTAYEPSPDTKDVTAGNVGPTATRDVSVVARASVFDWTDAAIGAVAGFAIALLLGGMILLLSTRGRQGSLAL